MALATMPPTAALASLSLADPVPRLADGGIKLMLAVQTPNDGASYIEAFATETIRDVTLRLRQSVSWFSPDRQATLVFGDRELLEHETVGTLLRHVANNNSPEFKHIILRLADVQAVNINIATQNGDSAGSGSSSRTAGAPAQEAAVTTPRSTLSSLLSASAAAAADAEQSSAAKLDAAGPLALVAQAGAQAPATPPAKGRTVVHLRVHRSAKVAWRPVADSFELTITAADTPATVRAAVERVSGMALAEPHHLMFGGRVLANTLRPLVEYGVTGDSELQLVPVDPQGGGTSFPDGSPLLSSPLHELHDNWRAARAGLSQGHAPMLAPAGTGGSYFLQDTAGQNVAVFKPEDEEPCAPANPKGHTSSGSWGGAAGGCTAYSEGLRRGVLPGEGAVREVAAYLLDHGHAAGVPPTALVTWQLDDRAATGSNSGSGGSSIKRGSLQQFVQAEGDCEERGPSLFGVDQVHKIAVLDIRLANTDRNGGNILLVRRGGNGTHRGSSSGGNGGANGNADGSSWELVPIDHGMILPASFEDISYEWLYWPQAKQHFAPATLDYIAGLDAERDIAILQAHNITLRPECYRVLRVCTMLLQKAAARRLTPFQIGCFMTRQAATKSHLEKLHALALQMAGPAAAAAAGSEQASERAQHESRYLAHMAQLIDQYLEEALLDAVTDDDVF